MTFCNKTILPFEFNQISDDEQHVIITNMKKKFQFVITDSIIQQIETELIKMNIESYLEIECEKVLKSKKVKKVKK